MKSKGEVRLAICASGRSCWVEEEEELLRRSSSDKAPVQTTPRSKAALPSVAHRKRVTCKRRAARTLSSSNERKKQPWAAAAAVVSLGGGGGEGAAAAASAAARAMAAAALNIVMGWGVATLPDAAGRQGMEDCQAVGGMFGFRGSGWGVSSAGEREEGEGLSLQQQRGRHYARLALFKRRSRSYEIAIIIIRLSEREECVCF